MTNSCGNPYDTGQQLMAANVGYDNEFSGLNAAHVQAAIDILADRAGLNYHPNLTGRDEDDQHPIDAITGLVDSLAGKAETNHTQPAATVTYDHDIEGLLGADEVQGAIDELARISSAGVLEYAALAIEVIPAEGIAASVNQMDWTGHDHADPVITTALNVQPNHVVTFGNSSDVAYRWVGHKPVLLGVGGNYLSQEEDYIAVGTADHSILTNRNEPLQHEIGAIDGLQAALDDTVEEAPTDGKEYVRRNAAWDVLTHPTANLLTGFKNLIINGFGSGGLGGGHYINQRSFDGNWGVAANYGFDRWYKYSGTHKAQKIEEESYQSGGNYTLHWAGGAGQGTIIASDGSTASGDSGFTMILTKGGANDLTVIVPYEAYNIQLERGTLDTTFEVRPMAIERMMCERYYVQAKIYQSHRIETGGSQVIFSQALVGTMRTNTQLINIEGASNQNFSLTLLSCDSRTVWANGTADAIGLVTVNYNLSLDAEM